MAHYVQCTILLVLPPEHRLPLQVPPTAWACIDVQALIFYLVCYSSTLTASSDEKWELKVDTEYSFYNIVYDDKMLYSCEPWEHDHAAWKIIYEGNRPVALHLIDDKITD